MIQVNQVGKLYETNASKLRRKPLGYTVCTFTAGTDRVKSFVTCQGCGIAKTGH